MPVARVGPGALQGEIAALEGGRRLASVRAVTAAEVLQIPVRAGRGFGSHDDAMAPRAAIVSEGLARALWPNETAVGRRVRVSGDSIWRTVVGVVGETHQPVESTPTFEIYVPFAQKPVPLLFTLSRVAGDPSEMGAALQRAVAKVDNGLGLANVRPLAE